MVAALSAAGLMVLPFAPRPVATVTVMALLAAGPAAWVATVRMEAASPRHTLLRSAVGDWVRTTLLLLGAHGWLATVGPATLLVVLALAVCSPPMMRRLRRRGAEDDTTHARAEDVGDVQPPVVVDLGAENVAAMSTAEIAARWRRTGHQLRQVTDDRMLELIALVRWTYLDELSRRDPDGLDAWLASEPGATGDPTVYFHREVPPSTSRPEDPN